MKEFQELNNDLLRLEEKLNRKKKLEKRLFHKRQALEKERTRLVGLEKLLNKEGEDLKKYDGMSLPVLFHTLLGSKERQVQIERREFLEAKLQRDEAAYSVKEMEHDIQETEAELRELAGVVDQYQTLMSQKEHMVHDHFPASAGELDRVTKESAAARSQSMEITEAIAAGTASRDALDGLIFSLKSAGDWGVWDILGGGMLVTAAKHSRMDEARDKLHHVQQLLGQFQRELGDVQSLTSSAEIQLGEFERFADLFFDGLIVDWMVQAKIEQSLSKANEARMKIEEILAYLISRQGQVDREIERLRAYRERMIREA